jgi:hypothetical protein
MKSIVSLMRMNMRLFLQRKERDVKMMTSRMLRSIEHQRSFPTFQSKKDDQILQSLNTQMDTIRRRSMKSFREIWNDSRHGIRWKKGHADLL